MKRIAFTLILLAGVANAQSPAKRAFTLADWYRVTTMRQPAMSPDGKWVALHGHHRSRSGEQATVRSVGRRGGWRTPTGSRRRVIESSTPRWAPDGRTPRRHVGRQVDPLPRSDDFAAAPEKDRSVSDGLHASGSAHSGLEFGTADRTRPAAGPTIDLRSDGAVAASIWIHHTPGGSEAFRWPPDRRLSVSFERPGVPARSHRSARVQRHAGLHSIV